MYTDLLKPLADKTDLIVLPEMFNSGFSMQPQHFSQSINGSTVAWMKQQAKILNSAICGSIAIEENGSYVNKFIFVHPNGALDQYNKRHCFRMSGENEVYESGEQKLIIEYCGWKILPQVCYDLRFPVFSRNQSDENNYDLAVYVANWPQVRRSPWLTLLQARAIENLAYVIGVNRIGRDGNDVQYSGDSIVVDFKGEIIFDHGDGATSNTQVLELNLLKAFHRKFPAWRDADQFSMQTGS
jgi:predicted amidohydrolase